MNWESWGTFWAMGGYGVYVWGSMGAAALAVAGELLALSLRRRAAVAGVLQGHGAGQVFGRGAAGARRVQARELRP